MILGVRWRISLAGAVCGVVGIFVMFAALRAGSRESTARSAGPTIGWVMKEYEGARCEAHPETWHLESPHRGRIWAYDEQLVARNPAAPPIDRLAAAELARGGHPDGVARYNGFFEGGALVARVADSGPCALVMWEWPPFYRRRDVFLFLLVSGLAVGLAGAAFSYYVAVRPIVRRIANVGGAAAFAGRDGYVSAEPRARDDLGQLARELDRAHERMRADAAEIERRRGDLQRHVAEIAHDLRTPIASLQLSLEQGMRGGNDPELVAAAQDVVYIGSLMANLELATELRAGPSKGGNVVTGLSESVERAVTRLRFLARRKGVELEAAVPDDPVLVAADPVAVDRVIANIVENAVSHGDSGGHVAVILALHGQGEFELSVVDDGPGVAPSELPRLGERAFRADAARARDGRGHGLGLSIASEVCARAGWELSFLNESPVGLRVTIRGRVHFRNTPAPT